MDAGKLAAARNILRRGHEVDQMMKVVGEEGTNIDDFVIYLKSEFLDFVYLQQNTFDEVDAATSQERQIYMFDRISSILAQKFVFDDKEQARRYFLELRLILTDMNYTPFKGEEFRALEQKMNEKISERAEKDA